MAGEPDAFAAEDDDELGRLIDRAMYEAFCDAVRAHRANGIPMVFWENGQIIRVDAKDVAIDESVSPLKGISRLPADG